MLYRLEAKAKLILKVNLRDLRMKNKNEIWGGGVILREQIYHSMYRTNKCKNMD